MTDIAAPESSYRFCPRCATPLAPALHGGVTRMSCPQGDFVHWDNPVPVVAAVVEYEGKILLARNALWPAGAFALITGFLERDDTDPATACAREVTEELGLTPGTPTLIGIYPFQRKNQVLIAYHVPASGTVAMNEELVEWKLVEFEKICYWPAGTGFALRDWLKSAHGVEAQPMEWPRR